MNKSGFRAVVCEKLDPDLNKNNPYLQHLFLLIKFPCQETEARKMRFRPENLVPSTIVVANT
jgi:hypothetical protein